LRFWLRSD